MKTQHNINKANNSVTVTRDPETDITKGASDTSHIEAAKENAMNNTDRAGTSPADIHDVLNGGHPNNEQHIKKENDEHNPLVEGI
ncbi:MAG: hypothetical protein EOO88_06015 [Pedobacter sp.]|nr:MAG: hypothetical protein EOO88_06015 [Pedobacter sp.]